MIELVVTGGQTGADQAGWRAAKAAGIPTGGWMPKGFKTEDGPRPEFAEMYGAVESLSAAYPPRTRMNVRESDATIAFDVAPTKYLAAMSRGTQLAISSAMRADKPSVVSRVELGKPIAPERCMAMAEWIARLSAKVINVAGNRESSAPGIGAWVEVYLSDVFRILKEQ